MIKVDLDEAEGRLGNLIQEAAAGQEVIITTAQGSAVRLVLMSSADSAAVAPRPSTTVGHALDSFIGTCSAEQEAEILRAVEVFEQVDQSFWQ